MKTSLLRAVACVVIVMILAAAGFIANNNAPYVTTAALDVAFVDASADKAMWTDPPARKAMPASYTPHTTLVTRTITMREMPRMQVMADAMMGYPITAELNDLLLPQLRLGAAGNVRVRLPELDKVALRQKIKEVRKIPLYADAAPRGE